MIGVHASVTMGDTRTIRVFVLGDAKFSGSYTISGLGTITSALFAAGGVQPIGSLRNIELKRHGELVRRLDLYDMLIRGDTTDDARLLPDDVIFIPPIGPTVSVDGEVHRPAIYEIRNETSVADAVQLAGGLTPEADTGKLALTRIDADLHRVVLQVDLTSAAGRAETVRNGDSLRVSRLRPTLDAGVVVQGYVYTPGAFAYRDGMRLTDVLRSVDDLKPNADLHYILIRRELPPDRRIAVLSADLTAALRAPGSAADVPLDGARPHHGLRSAVEPRPGHPAAARGPEAAVQHRACRMRWCVSMDAPTFPEQYPYRERHDGARSDQSRWGPERCRLRRQRRAYPL